MNIETALNNITSYNPETSYQTFLDIMDKATIQISIWGERKVYVVGYSGSVQLEEICEKVIALSKSYPQFNEEERQIGRQIQNKIGVLEKISDTQFENCRNPITYIYQFIMFLCDPCKPEYFSGFFLGNAPY